MSFRKYVRPRRKANDILPDAVKTPISYFHTFNVFVLVSAQFFFRTCECVAGDWKCAVELVVK